MALAFTLRLDFIDDKGKESFTKVRLPTGFTLAQYTEFGQAAAQLFANISQAQITAVSIGFNVDLSGAALKTVASAVTSVAKKLWLRFNTAVTGFRAQTLIPGIRETQVIAGSGDANQADVDIAAVISAFEDGIAVTLGTLTFTNDREHDITTVQTATERFLKRSAT